VGLTTSSIAQLGSSLGKNLTSEGVRPNPMNAPSIRTNGGRRKENIKKCDSGSSEGTYCGPVGREGKMGLTVANIGRKSKHVLHNCIKQTQTV
jgi:hypothetical protein